MKPGQQQPPQRVPVLTEVVVLPKAAPAPAGEVDEFPPVAPAAPFAAPAAAPVGGREIARPAPVATAAPDATASIDEARVAQRVLADLDKQLDLMFEHRLRESLTPVLARMTDSLVREMRNQLAANMREMVARAVSIELDRLQKR